MSLIPITVFTGYLGSGKTTVISKLLPQFPSDYQVCLLKNEFGDINVDALLLKETNIKVTEIINGCLCCVLVGKLGNALLEINDKYSPDRIFIETSGSALPAPIALEINKYPEKFKLDGIINVVDCLNFIEYKDTSYTAKNQASFTDIILLNKHELVSETQLDKVLDAVNQLNSSTPKLKTNNGFVNVDNIIGIDSKLNFKITATHDSNEFDIFEVHSKRFINSSQLINFFSSLPRWDFIRIKGVTSDGINTVIINGVLGRYDSYEVNYKFLGTNLVIIGKNLEYHKDKLITGLSLTKEEYSLVKSV